MKTRHLGYLLAGTLLVGLAGCGSTSANGSSEIEAPSKEANASEHKATAKGHYETKTIMDEAAWPEIVIDAKGYTERVSKGTQTVVDEEAWDEYIPKDYDVCGCGAEFDSPEALNDHMMANNLEGPHASGSFSMRWETVHHEAVTHEEEAFEEVCHPPVTHTILHPAKTHTEKIWVKE